MKIDLLNYLCCPHCQVDLMLSSYNKKGAEIIDGHFKCTTCKKIWLIINGIPRFVDKNLTEIIYLYQSFLKKYKSELERVGWITKNSDAENADLDEIKEKISDYFGYEWKYFKNWGWINDNDVSEEEKKYNYLGGLISNTESAFKKKCMLDNVDLKIGKLVLDAGCGNGRYTNQAAKYGAVVIGIDLGYGVESAYDHLKNLNNVHIAQGDLFALPFKKKIFDSIFSNGVLMHTGDAKKAFLLIAKHIKQGGIFVVHLYHKRNLIFEMIDSTLRFFTTKLSIKNNLKFAQFMANWGKKLIKNGTWKYYYKFIEVLPTAHHMYDWYSAQIATHHTYSEVKKWYRELNYKIVKTNEPHKITLINKPESLTIKGVKN